MAASCFGPRQTSANRSFSGPLQSGDFDADGIGSAMPSAVVRTAGDG
jgi:hypothetical protein